MGKFLHDFFVSFWWGARTLWWFWWNRLVPVLALFLWLVCVVVVLLMRPPGGLLFIAVVSGATVVLWVVPFWWSAHRLYSLTRQPALAAWIRADAEVAKELRSEWIGQLRELGFTLAGYLTRDENEAPRLALLINSGDRDSAHVSRLAGKDLLVFETRFADGFAFETCNSRSSRSLPDILQNPVFHFSQLDMLFDLYRVHQSIKKHIRAKREPVISDGEGEISEFISRAQVARRHLMSRDYQLKGDTYRFTVTGASRKAVLLTWPVKQIREALFHRKSLKQLASLGFDYNKRTGRLVER